MTTYVISSNPVHPDVARRTVPEPATASRRAAARNRYLVSPRILGVLLALAAMSVLATSVQADQPVAVVSYTVVAGDTLWSIAQDITPAGADVRETVAVVRELNDLDASIIHPDEVLRLPTG